MVFHANFTAGGPGVSGSRGLGLEFFCFTLSVRTPPTRPPPLGRTSTGPVYSRLRDPARLPRCRRPTQYPDAETPPPPLFGPCFTPTHSPQGRGEAPQGPTHLCPPYLREWGFLGNNDSSHLDVGVSGWTSDLPQVPSFSLWTSWGYGDGVNTRDLGVDGTS